MNDQKPLEGSVLLYYTHYWLGHRTYERARSSKCPSSAAGLRRSAAGCRSLTVVVPPASSGGLSQADFPAVICRRLYMVNGLLAVSRWSTYCIPSGPDWRTWSDQERSGSQHGVCANGFMVSGQGQSEPRPGTWTSSFSFTCRILRKNSRLSRA